MKENRRKIKDATESESARLKRNAEAFKLFKRLYNAPGADAKPRKESSKP